MGAGLKVLLEQNENELAVGTGHNNVPTDKKKYFQNNYNQIKQKSVNQTEQENSLNQIKETAAVVTCPEKSVDNYKMKIDEENITTEIELKDSVVTISDDHPLSSQDIHFTFNTLELKSLTPRISKN